MTGEEERAALEALVRDRRDDLAGLSRMLRRNPAYLQQYLRRGTPRRLAEHDRRELARYFNVDDAQLGGPASAAPAIVPADAGKGLRHAALVAIPGFAIGASAGPGALPGAERATSRIALPAALLRELGIVDPARLSMIRVVGESMRPTLADGDDILVDAGDAADRLRDGIYVLRAEEALLVKRIAVKPGGGFAVLSDNPDHPDLAHVRRADLHVVGRVLWAGRKLR